MGRSIIQKNADDIVEAMKTDKEEVMAEQPEHGPALRLNKKPDTRTWVYDDGFHKDIDIKADESK